jgi:hypothetical protein
VQQPRDNICTRLRGVLEAYENKAWCSLGWTSQWKYETRSREQRRLTRVIWLILSFRKSSNRYSLVPRHHILVVSVERQARTRRLDTCRPHHHIKRELHNSNTIPPPTFEVFFHHRPSPRTEMSRECSEHDAYYYFYPAESLDAFWARLGSRAAAFRYLAQRAASISPPPSIPCRFLITEITQPYLHPSPCA